VMTHPNENKMVFKDIAKLPSPCGALIAAVVRVESNSDGMRKTLHYVSVPGNFLGRNGVL